MTHNASAQGQPDIQDGFSTKSDPMPPQSAGWGVDMRDKPELCNKILGKGSIITESGCRVDYDYKVETPHGAMYVQKELVLDYQPHTLSNKIHMANDFSTKAVDSL